MKLLQKSSEVFLAEGPIAAIGVAEIEVLKSALAKSPKGRVRINAHLDDDDRLHEMFIAFRPDSYLQPHMHPSKTESFHIVYGAVDIVVFEEDGRIRQVVPLGAGNPKRAFFYRMSKPFYHTLVIRSDLLVIHEITNGPFQPSETVYASFAPAASDAAAVAAYQAALVKKIDLLGVA
jgi:cupin fold WbuC family metalloprotein